MTVSILAPMIRVAYHEEVVLLLRVDPFAQINAMFDSLILWDMEDITM
jgi:hypothetical protein